MALSSHLSSLYQSISLPSLTRVPSAYNTTLQHTPISVSADSSGDFQLYKSFDQPYVSPEPSTPTATSSMMKPYRLCTLCHHRIHGQQYSFPKAVPAALSALRSFLREPGQERKNGRYFCRKCWIRIYDLSLCWTCGEIVHRGEERVGFGWCWWHWGCVSCLFCRVCEFVLFVEGNGGLEVGFDLVDMGIGTAHAANMDW